MIQHTHVQQSRESPNELLFADARCGNHAQSLGENAKAGGEPLVTYRNARSQPFSSYRVLIDLLRSFRPAGCCYVALREGENQEAGKEAASTGHESG